MTNLEKELQTQVDYYKHEYFAECELRGKLEKALDKASKELEEDAICDDLCCYGKRCDKCTKEERIKMWKEWLQDEK